MNRYIKAMEIGLANEKNGISYFTLIEQLQKELGYDFGYSSEYTFLSWFFDNFSTNSNLNVHDRFFRGGKEHYLQEKHRLNDNISGHDVRKKFAEKLEMEYFLKGQAAKQYLDYLELQESVKAANNAQEASRISNIRAAQSVKLAIIAIILSSLLGLFSILLPIFLIEKPPQPPYDVKVIEDTEPRNWKRRTIV